MTGSSDQPIVRIRKRTDQQDREIETFSKVRTVEFSSSTIKRELKNSQFDIGDDFIDGIRFNFDRNQHVEIRGSIRKSVDDPLSLFLEVEGMNSEWMILEMDLSVKNLAVSELAFVGLFASASPRIGCTAALRLIKEDLTEYDHGQTQFSLDENLRSVSLSFPMDRALIDSHSSKAIAAKIVIHFPRRDFVMRLRKATVGPV